jgi:iron complex outermembrane receptor protein
MAAGAAFAQSAAREYRIEQKTLDQALREFALASNLDLLFSPDLVAGKPSPRLEGVFTVEEALTALLRGSGLDFQVQGSRVVITRASESPGQSSSPTSSINNTPHYTQLAQKQGGPAESATPAAASDAALDKRIELEEIVVTGSRLRRASAGAMPVVTFDNETIAELGVTDIADVLDYLPQSSYSLGEDFIVGGAKPVQLRGLNFGTTLLLVNGRRTVTSAAQGFRNFFDLNTIPLSAVERVEVLSESASAVYGADAIGGVVNVILKDHVDDTTVDVYYGGAQGGGEELRTSATTGFDSDAFRLLVGADYFKRDYLLGDERWPFRDQDYTRFGGSDLRSTVSNPGNVLSLAGPLPGLSSNQAGIPAGTDGVGLTPADFIATQGPQGLNRESSRRFASVLPESERISAFINAELDLSQSASLFAELLYTHRDEARQLTPTTLSNGSISNTVGTVNGIIVPATNPFNPFGVPVVVNYLFEGVGPREEKLDEDFYRFVAGLRGSLGDWRYELSVLRTQDDSTQTTTNEVDPARVVAALAETDPANALNLFADGPAGSPSLLASLVGNPQPNEFGSDATQVSGFLSGSLFSLPAGEVQLVIGGEWREEKLDFIIPSGLAVNLHADRQTRAAFGELLIPFVGERMNVPLVRELTLTAAVRYDRYSDFGGTTNPKIGLEWRPSSDLLFRGSWGTSYRAPSLFELYFDSTTQMGQFPDPLRPPQFPGLPGELVVITLTSGGNPDLEPEEAESFSAGVVYQPSFLEGLDLSLDYFSIDQSLRVQSPDALTLLLNADLFPERVTRAPPTPEDIAAGLPGRLLALDIRRLNLGRIETDGVDFRLNYRARTSVGTFTPSLSATWVHSYKAANFPGQPLVERVGTASRDPGTVPEWKAVAGLSWSRSGWQAGFSARFVSSYQDVNVSGVEIDRRMPAQWYLDVNTSYRFDESAASGLLRGVTLRLGAANVLDREVEYSDVNIIGYDPSQADIRGRFVYGSISKTF